MVIYDRGVDIKTDSRIEQRNDMSIAPARKTMSKAITACKKTDAKVHNYLHMAKNITISGYCGCRRMCVSLQNIITSI